MSISPREAFELGFLQKCAEEGLSKDQIEARVKRASVMIKGAGLTDFANAIRYMTEKSNQKLPHSGTAALMSGMVGLPLLASYGAGTAAKSLQSDLTDPEEVKKQEMINELKALTVRNRVSGSKALGL